MSTNTTLILSAVIGAAWALQVFPVIVSLTIQRVAGKTKTEPYTDPKTSQQGVHSSSSSLSYFMSLLRVTFRSSVQTIAFMALISFAVLTVFSYDKALLAVAMGAGGFAVAMLVRLRQHFYMIRAEIKKNGTFRIMRMPDGSYKIGGGESN